MSFLFRDKEDESGTVGDWGMTDGSRSVISIFDAPPLNGPRRVKS